MLRRFAFGILSLFMLWALTWAIVRAFFAQKIFLSVNLDYQLLPPLAEGFILGTDVHGRSIAHLLSEGLIYSLGLSFSVSLSAAAIGLFLGYLSIYQGVFSKIIDLFTDLVFVFPSILMAILVLSLVGESVWALYFVLTFSAWPAYAKLSHGECLQIQRKPFIEAAESLGVSVIRKFFIYYFPNLLPAIAVHFVLALSGVIITESTLGFLGLGGNEESWGALMASGKDVLLEGPHVVASVSAIMGPLIFSLNILGDELRDLLDPYSLPHSPSGK